MELCDGPDVPSSDDDDIVMDEMDTSMLPVPVVFLNASNGVVNIVAIGPGTVALA